MTNNNNLKQAARAYAATHGVAYAQALREVKAQQQIPEGFTSRRVLTIQQALRADDVLPYPFFVDQNGFVDRQDFWRGEPFRLIGFVADPDVYEIGLTVEAFVKNPLKALGMHPVMVDRAGNMATYTGPVESVESGVRKVAASETVTATVTTVDGAMTKTFGVGHLMWLLNDSDFDGNESDGVVRADVGVEMFSWLMSDPGGQDVDQVHDVYSHAENLIDTGAVMIDEQPFTVQVDPVRVREWANSLYTNTHTA